MSRRVNELSAAGRGKWWSVLKSEFVNSPVASNVGFSLILAALEKLVEMEFACPCNPSWNRVLTAGFFLVPAIAACVLICMIRKWNQDTAMFCLIQLMVWHILLFFDGRYFACAQTDWSGRFVYIDEAKPLKWCEPTNNNSTQEFIKMTKTQRWYSLSQGIGVILVFLSFLTFGGFKIIKRKNGEHQVQRNQRGQQDQQHSHDAL